MPESDNQKEEKTAFGRVKPSIIEEEMQRSYLDYAMSVIVSRALPDVRDGLKPVHRRVLFSMFDIGLTSKSKYRKSATVVGDVLGKYHPHGDIAVYDTLVRMAQEFAMREPLVDGQGNFGSVDGDEPAAMRYTECRMSKIAEEMLADINKNTVPFVDNYDATRKEPKVLPAGFPNLLVNGSMGIAVGMATNIPPHNLGEVVDATNYLIDNPDCDVEDLMVFIKGPDFPTGGEIYNINEIKNAYINGQGKVVMRAKSEIIEGKKGLFKIIVNEIPFQVNKANLIEQMAKLIKDKKIIGISDIRDESDKDGIRIVIELKRDAYPQKVLNQLYKHTQMQSAFHVNMLALVDGIQPKVLTLKNVISYYIAHRKEIITKRTKFDLERAKAHAHILEGLLKALKNIDAVVDTIKKSENREIAHKNLVKKFTLSDKQAEAILEMRLSALSGLERKKIEKDYEETKKLIAALQKILASEKEIAKVIKNELIALKEKFATPRKTQVHKKAVGEFEAEDLIPDEQVIVTLTRGNYVKRMPMTAYRSQQRGGKGVLGITTKEEDTVNIILEASTHDDLLFFTNKGRVFTVKTYELTSATRQAKGQAAVNLLSIAPEESITSIINISSRENLKYLLMATKKGLVKKTNILAYQKVRKSGLIAVRLRKDDELDWVKPTGGDDQIILATKKGMAIRFSERDARPMGRAASGVRGIRLRASDEVVGMDVVAKPNVLRGAGDASEIAEQGRKSTTGDLLIVTERGKGKRTILTSYPVQHRGGIGLRTARLTPRTGDISQMKIVDFSTDAILIISKRGQVIRMPIGNIKRLGRSTSGVTLMKLNRGDSVASVTILEAPKEESGNGNGNGGNNYPNGGNGKNNNQKPNNQKTKKGKEKGAKKMGNLSYDQKKKLLKMGIEPDDSHMRAKLNRYEGNQKPVENQNEQKIDEPNINQNASESEDPENKIDYSQFPEPQPTTEEINQEIIKEEVKEEVKKAEAKPKNDINFWGKEGIWKRKEI